MAYTIKLRIQDDKRNRIAAIDDWQMNDGPKWTEWAEGFVLTMGGSGTSGMIIFRSTNNETFAIATGVHNYKRWCDIKVDLDDNASAQRLLRLYYQDNKPEWSRLWAQASSTAATTSKKNGIKVNFTVVDGNQLAADVIYTKANVDEGGLEFEPVPNFGDRGQQRA